MDKEIVKEIAKEDVNLYGIASIMDKRKKNQALRISATRKTYSTILRSRTAHDKNTSFYLVN